jgi:NAD+ synthase (glutamine-hydrolysing)
MNTSDKRATFRSLYFQRFCRAVVTTPRAFPAEPSAPAHERLALESAAVREDAIFVLYPGLGPSGYAPDDLSVQGPLFEAAEASISEIAAGSTTLKPIQVVSALLRAKENCSTVPI